MRFTPYTLYILSLLALSTACSPDEEVENKQQAENHHQNESLIHLSDEQLQALNIKVDTLRNRNMAATVQTNGQLEVPPQNEATVTAMLGANVTSIQIIEGEEVKEGQILAYLAHPEITRLQGDYLSAYNQLQYLEKEYARQKRLYENEIGSGKNFQQVQADYQNARAQVQSYQAQLQQLGMRAGKIQNGDFYTQIPLRSPIEGTIVKVEVKTGQYVQPDKDLFEVVNTHHIHADLMVFEKDVYKVEEGQMVRFRVETMPNSELYAEIYSVGKKFEENPKALHVHAEIENKTGKLIPGMYIKGEILTDSTELLALPEEAIVREGNQFFAFLLQENGQADATGKSFKPVELRSGTTHDGWVAVSFLEELSRPAVFAMNGAYYLQAELKKGEAEHSH